MSNKITQEEREQVLKALEEVEEVSSICLLRNIFVTTEGCQGVKCSECQKQVKEKLIAFVKQVPAKKNIRAAELADKLEQTYKKTQDAFKTFREVFWL